MKTTLKSALVNILAGPGMNRLGKAIFGCGTPIFMLHRFSDDGQNGMSRQALDENLTFLTQKGYNFISLKTLVTSLATNTPIPDKSIAFTIDDGFIDQLSIAAPVFQKHQCPVTIFVITDFLDGKLWPWDDQVSYLIKQCMKSKISVKIANESLTLPLTDKQSIVKAIITLQDSIKANPTHMLNNYLSAISEATEVTLPNVIPEKYQPITWDMAREFEKNGIEFAPHTLTHRILSQLDDKHVKQELLGSWKRLKEELSAPVPIFGYPTGRPCDYGEREIKILKGAGFLGAVSTEPKQASHDLTKDNLFHIPRLSLPHKKHDILHDISWLGYIRN